MSGGVDSAVTAYLLKKEGYEVCGVTLRTWAPDDGTDGRCCEIDDARRVSEALGIRFYPLNCVSDFARTVVDPFVRSYLSGQTPNPCIECNRFLKWEKMLYAAKVMQADYIATGHYAHVVQLENGRYTVKKALYAAKDQTYMLYKLTQEQLAATLMPLGDYAKDQVRQIAQEASLPVAHKPDSQEICFVTDGHYADFIEEYAKKKNSAASGHSAADSLMQVPEAETLWMRTEISSVPTKASPTTRSARERVWVSPWAAQFMSKKSAPFQTKSCSPMSPPCSKMS